jgi:hypothetical protein
MAISFFVITIFGKLTDLCHSRETYFVINFNTIDCINNSSPKQETINVHQQDYYREST